MKTTLYIEDGLLKEIKADALREGVSVTAYTENALREVLAKRQVVQKSAPVELPVFHGDGVLPGVDISNSASLLDIMES